jgi:hypothetical protein
LGQLDAHSPPPGWARAKRQYQHGKNCCSPIPCSGGPRHYRQFGIILKLDVMIHIIRIMDNMAARMPPIAMLAIIVFQGFGEIY